MMNSSDNGSDVLLEAFGLINGPRQETYGHPYDDYSIVRDVFYGLTGVDLTVEQSILFMVAIKLARLRTNLERGDLHRDSIVDAAGYLGCLSMAHQEGRRRSV